MSQADSVAMTVLGLQGGLSGVIQGEPNDQKLNLAVGAECLDTTDIVVEVATSQRIEWSHGQSKAVATRESDSSTAHIKAES